MRLRIKSNNPYFPLMIILLVTIVSLTLYSFIEKPLEVFNYPIKKNSIKEYFLPLPDFQRERVTKVSVYDSTDYSGDIIVSNLFHPTPPQTMDTSKQRILLIGDSMLEGLGLRLHDYCVANGHEMMQVIWYSSSTLWYGSCDTIAYYIKQYKPTYVILVIGSMELFIRDITVKRKQYVVEILNQVGKTHYIWVGPPNWTDDTGINDLLSSSVDSATFFLSKDLTFDRCDDGAHPTHASASRWMDSIATFMMYRSAHPILMKFPENKAPGRPSTRILGANPPSTLK